MRALLTRTALAVGLAVAAVGWPARGASTAGAASFPNDEQAIIHVLSRIGFGPRPGDVEQVRTIGLQKYIDQQLHPEHISDSVMTAHLVGMPTLRMSTRDIVEQYAMPLIEARRNQRMQNATSDGPALPKGPDPLQQRSNRVVVELSEHKMLRAVYSDRQLEEVLTDFWFNHFNVDARKGLDRYMLTEYERDTIRPHVLGKFRDLLEATAKSPAMLFYLDNWMSARPNGPDIISSELQPPGIVRRRFGPTSVLPPRMARRPAQGPNAPKGLNENYGRELMELHTLGVDGGYTQKDVTEVARAFTGWTIQNPRQGGGFRFEPRLHDEGQKVVLGHVIKAGGGMGDGEQVLDILAKHPSTARFIAMKLARRLVSDNPPPALVDRARARFRETDGDLREVIRTILTSTEFLSPDAYHAKIKTPFEFVVSSLRAVNADVQDARPLVRAMQQLGMPLYQCQPPTGYKDTGDAWVNTGALVARMNFALQLASNRLPGTTVDSRQAIVDGLSGDVSESTRATIAKAKNEPQMVALTLGAPEFQRR